MVRSKGLGKLKSIFGLSFQLAKTDFKLKNEGSYLGILWYLLDPFIMFLILFMIRNITASGVENYPLYLLLGLVMFNFFKKTTTEAAGSISGNSGLIKSINLRKEVFIFSTFLKNLFSHFFEIILLIGFLLFFKMPLINLIYYPFILLFFGFFILGISFLVSTIGVYITDFKNIWAVLTRLLWFVTPIFYKIKLELPFNINAFNPVYYFITVGREIIVYNKIPNFGLIMGMIFFGLIFFLIGFIIFQKYKIKFAERI